MMHNNGFVVFLQENNKPVREYEHKKLCNINSSVLFLPFNTEFRFGFKVLDGKRRRLEITVDGAEITKDLIVDKGESFLERYLNSDKKFKVVDPNSLQCSDPTNSENGVIRIKVFRELVFPSLKSYSVLRSVDIDPTYTLHHTHHDIMNMHLGASHSNDHLVGAQHVYCAQPAGEKVAIGEGSVSSQKIGNTFWLGDEFGYLEEFVFYIRAPSKLGPTVTNQTHCHSCGVKIPQNVCNMRFCHCCGNQLLCA